MRRDAILAAAVALYEFRVHQLAAYCGATPDEVEAALATVPSMVGQTGPQRWRVLLPAAMRAEVSHAEPPEARQRTQGLAVAEDARRAGLTARLVIAEEALIECGTESSPELRQVMAATARNNVLQLLAQLTPEQGPWWGVEEPGPWNTESFSARIDAAGETAPAEIALPRLWADLELASITGREAAGEPVLADDLMRAAARLRDALKLIADERLDQLLQRFIKLAMGLVGPAGLDAPGRPARTRLLVVLAWRRLRLVAEKDVRQASEAVLLILQQLQKEGTGRAGRTIDVYRSIERLPDGWNRLVVYRDLLELLPCQWQCHRRQELLPGVLVEAIADPNASAHLAWIATRLENGLDRSPSKSESALIGEAAHIFQDVADYTAADVDASVVQRSDQMREQLLSLAYAPSGK